MADFNWDVSIRPAGNGIVASFGCKTLVFKNEDAKEFLDDLDRYLFGDARQRGEVAAKYFPEYGPQPEDELCERVNNRLEEVQCAREDVPPPILTRRR